jgi:two-component system NtrC family sensor kinase
MVFRIRGSLISSLVFLCAVLPRALIISIYPDPILRPLLFVAVAAFASLLIATQLNRIEEEEKANKEAREAYEQFKENQQQLAQTEKLASLGQMAAFIAHEVNNPLAGVLAYTQLLTRKVESNEITRDVALNYLSKIELETTRSGKLLRNLLDFSRQSSLDFKLVDVNEVIEKSLDLVIHSAKGKNIQVVKDLCMPIPGIIADFDQLQQVCTNLMLNAFQAMNKGGTLTVGTSVDYEGVSIEIKDTGCGITTENMAKLFTPFFTTKREVQGVGLGLAVAYGIVKSHKGKIEVSSQPGEGTTFTVRFPLAEIKPPQD